MGFHVNLGDLDKAITAYGKAAQTTEDTLDGAKKAMNHIVSGNALYGAAGQAVANDVNNYSNAINVALKDAYTFTVSTFAQELSDFQGTVGETSPDAVLDEDGLNRIVKDMTVIGQANSDAMHKANNTLQNVADLVDVAVPHDKITDEVKDAMKFLKDINSKVQAFDKNQSGEESLEDLVNGIDRQLNSAMSSMKLSFSDPNVQIMMAQSDFAKQIAKMDEPVAKAQKQRLKDQKDWEARHPIESLWKKAADELVDLVPVPDLADALAHGGAKWLDQQGLPGMGTRLSLLLGAVKALGEVVNGDVLMVTRLADYHIAVVRGVSSKLSGETDWAGMKQVMAPAEALAKFANVNHLQQTFKGLEDAAFGAVKGVVKDLKEGNPNNLGEDAVNLGSLFVGPGEAKGAEETERIFKDVDHIGEAGETAEALEATAAAGKTNQALKTGDGSAAAVEEAALKDAPKDTINHPIENGPYIRDGKPHGRPTLRGKARLAFEKAVYNRQVGPDGILRDPNTREVIDWKPGEPRTGKVDFGHISGRPYRDIFKQYKDGEISLQKLKDFQFNPNNFRLEKPSVNRSHKFE